MRKLIVLFLIFKVAILPAQEIRDFQIDQFDFEKVDAYLKIYPKERFVTGSVTYHFETLESADTLFINAKQMQFSEVLLNGDPVEFSSDETGIYLIHEFNISESNTVSLNYEVHPKKAMYFINWEFPDLEDSKKQVWTQGQGKYTSSWLPSIDDMREKAEFDLKIEFPEGFEVVPNGVQTSNSAVNDSVRLWEFDMQKPMSSYLVGIAAGIYKSKKQTTATGNKLQFYYLPEDSTLVEPTYRYSAEIMEFFEKEIGVEYPWEYYKQIPVQEFLYSGMENTGTTIFSEALMTDETGFKDRNYVNVNAHELAHQWFGNLVTESNGEHHWLQEGFATYYALLAEKEIFGEDYYYWKLYETAEALKKLSDSGKGRSLVDPNAGSLTFYQKGAWALHILREKVGEEAFKKGVKNYLQLYAYKNVETDNFLAEMELASGMDLSEYKKDWILQTAFKANQSLNSLKSSEFITSYLNIAALRETPLSQKFEYLGDALKFPVNDYIGQEVVYQLSGNSSPQALELYSKAFASNNVFVRQAIANSMQQIPQTLKSNFESLLHDESYLTKEFALYRLWEQFPENRAAYFEETRGIDGFYNKNVRMLWLTLNLVTPEIDPDRTEDYYAELSGYTEESKPFQIRENACGYLYQIGAFSDGSLQSLVKATRHHTTSFRDYSRQLLVELLKNEQYREKLMAVAENMPESETTYLRSKI